METTLKTAKNQNSSKTADARIIAVRILNLFQKQLAPLSLLLNRFEIPVDLSAKDRSLIYELVFGTIRWQIQLDYLLKQFVHGNLPDLPLSVQNILRMSLYQIRFLDQIPNYAVVNEAAKLTRKFRQIRFTRLVNGVLRNYLRHDKQIRLPRKEENPLRSLSVRFAFPEWMVELFMEQYGEEKATAIMKGSNRKPSLTVRVNTKKISPENFRILLEKENIPTVQSKYFPEFFHVDEAIGSIKNLPGFSEGYFSVQDESAGIVAHLAKSARAGGRIADICAAPGGKLTHLAELSGERQPLIGIDLSRSRLQMIAENRERLGLNGIRLLQADGAQLPVKKMDVILVDAPCSGLGVMRKNPDIKLRRKPEDLQQAARLQRRLLDQAAEQIVDGGALIYSTCTINKNENEEVIQAFLHHHPEFDILQAGDFLAIPRVEKEGWVKTTPDMGKMDGSFCVRLQKRNT